MLEIMALAAPLAMVLAGRTLLSAPPPSATTTTVSSPTAPIQLAAAPKPLSAEQQKAQDWVKGMPATLELISPLNHPVEVVVAKPEIIADHEPEPEPQPLPVESPIRGLKLTAVIGNDDGQVAAINGRIYRIGELVKPKLRLTAIDPKKSSITLTAGNGETYRLKREQPLQPK